MMAVLIIGLCAVYNRLRGSNCWNHIPHDTVTRLMFALLTAFTGLYPLYMIQPIKMLPYIGITAALLFQWSLYAWDTYWGACAGQYQQGRKGWPPLDWLLSRLPLKTGTRIWGIVGMGLRQGLPMIPVFLVLGYFVNPAYYFRVWIPFLFGVPYWAYSYISKNNFVEWSEYTIGGLIGLCLIMP